MAYSLLTTLSFLLAALLGILLPATTHATCKLGYESSCDSQNFTATSSIFFEVDSTATNAGSETYNVTVIFHWGVENITVGPAPYNIGEPAGLSNSYQYADEGYYIVGTTIIFEDDAAAGCSGERYDKSTVIHMEKTPSRCEWNAKTPPPTMSPTISMGPTGSVAPSDAPTKAPVVSSGGVAVFGGGSMDQFGLFVVVFAAAVGNLLI